MGGTQIDGADFVRSRSVVFRPKVSRSQLETKALVIQTTFRQSRQQRIYEELHTEEQKHFQQKYAGTVISEAATVIEARLRGNKVRAELACTKQDALDEAEVEHYQHERAAAAQKQLHFKPCNPPSYYRGAAAIIQRRARQNGIVTPRATLPPPFVPPRRPVNPNSRLKGAVVFIQAFERGKRARRQLGISSIVPSQPAHASKVAVKGDSLLVLGGGGKSLVGANSETGRDKPDAASAKWNTAAKRIAQTATISAAMREQAVLSTSRQGEAEDQFLLADTSGDGYVDEDELVFLFSLLLKKVSHSYLSLLPSCAHECISLCMDGAS